ncbi:hypothetical protein ES705_18542 [subsurface metagenome]
MNEFIDKLFLRLDNEERKILDTIIEYKGKDLEIVLQEINSLMDKRYLSDLKKINEIMYLLDYSGELEKNRLHSIIDIGRPSSYRFTPAEIAKSFNSLIGKCKNIKIERRGVVI